MSMADLRKFGNKSMVEMNFEPKDYHVAAFYCFVRLDALEALKQELIALGVENGLCGTLLLADEGFNGTLAALDRTALERFLARLKVLARNHPIELKYSFGSDKPFRRLRIRLKREIVTMGVPAIDPKKIVGTYVEPEAWNDLIAQDDVIVIDTRNNYETAIGTFDGAIDPETPTFKAFPKWVNDNAPLFEGKRIAMFCTGGIRCEKATAYMKSAGYENVFHLKGGILKYLEDVPAEESRWKGSCFVFDDRVALDHGLTEVETVPCLDCGTPVPKAPLNPNKTCCPDCTREKINRDKELLNPSLHKDLSDV